MARKRNDKRKARAKEKAKANRVKRNKPSAKTLADLPRTPMVESAATEEQTADRTERGLHAALIPAPCGFCGSTEGYATEVPGDWSRCLSCGGC